ncbi:stabilizer of axonemal microtubules 4 isoform X2 [Buteo buteo]|uniref:stabilizer of axonemal microtubules 4 isoform X2 n=1 Tax=Buteo buteo TaxID=30397 RepID=UPI003EB6A08F
MCHCAAVTRRQRHHPKDSPAVGLGIVSPSVKARTGGSADLMNFYATSYAVAYGQPRFCPCLGPHTDSGYVSNNHSAISCLLCPRGAAEGRCQDTATSTTTEHFKPFWLPDGRSLLPRHIHQPESGYLQESSLSCPHTGGVSPQHTRLLQGPPRASREHSTESCRAGPAQPGMVLGVSVVLGPAPSPGGFGVSVIPGLGPTPGGFGGVGGPLPCITHTCPPPNTGGQAGAVTPGNAMAGSRVHVQAGLGTGTGTVGLPPCPICSPQMSCRRRPSVPRSSQASPGPPQGATTSCQSCQPSPSALASPQRITCPLCAATAARHSRRAPREATGSAGRCQAVWARRSRWGSPLTVASM